MVVVNGTDEMMLSTCSNSSYSYRDESGDEDSFASSFTSVDLPSNFCTNEGTSLGSVEPCADHWELLGRDEDKGNTTSRSILQDDSNAHTEQSLPTKAEHEQNPEPPRLERLSKDAPSLDSKATVDAVTLEHLPKENETSGGKLLLLEQVVAGSSKPGSISHSWCLTGQESDEQTSLLIDLISLSDTTTKRKCGRCSLLNLSTDSVCKGCSFALVANPQVAADAELAEQLQLKRKMEAQAHRRGLRKQSMLAKSEFLADSILTAIQQTKQVSVTPTSSFSTLTLANLIVLASRYLDHCSSRGSYEMTSFTICYAFSDAATMRDIMQHGFPNGFQFQENLQLAARARHMGTEVEDERLFDFSTETVGWIAVAATSSCTNQGLTVGTTLNALPLVCYKPQMAFTHQAMIEQSVHNLNCVLDNCFDCLNMHEMKPVSDSGWETSNTLVDAGSQEMIFIDATTNR